MLFAFWPFADFLITFLQKKKIAEDVIILKYDPVFRQPVGEVGENQWGLNPSNQTQPLFNAKKCKAQCEWVKYRTEINKYGIYRKHMN